jgi:hypothetical protein
VSGKRVQSFVPGDEELVKIVDFNNGFRKTALNAK